MKKSVFVFLFFSSVIIGCAQNESHLSGAVNLIRVDNFNVNSFNLSFEWAMSEDFNLRYELGIGSLKENLLYLHTPATAYLGGAFVGASFENNSNFFGVLGILLLAIPEGFSYSIPLGEKFELSPFMDFNSMEIFDDPNSSSMQTKLSADAGLTARVNLSDEFCLSVYSSATLLESRGMGFSAGLSIGYRLHL